MNKKKQVLGYALELKRKNRLGSSTNMVCSKFQKLRISSNKIGSKL